MRRTTQKHRTSAWTGAAIVGLLAAVFAGCTAEMDAEDVADARRNYHVELQNFIVLDEEEPAGGMEMDTGSETDLGEAGEEVAGAGEAEDAEAGEEGDVAAVGIDPVPRPERVSVGTGGDSEVLLDIVLRHTGATTLEGLTIDITHADAERREKNQWHVWVETTDLTRGGRKQFSHTLTGVDYEPGDGFHVGLRENVPPEEYSEYREFTGLGDD